jgi:hypothetical protein
MSKPQGFGTAALAMISVVTVACCAASASIATPSKLEMPGSTTSAHTSRALKTTDEARMRYVKHRSSSSRLFEEGTAHGTLPGSMDAYCSLGATFSASFTIRTAGGTIEGHGAATPHAGGGLYESFAGTLTVTGGTGRFARAHGHAGLYGTFNRRTYSLTVQTTGSLSY